jgi:NitT/TauT family transport system substrate-binding protein
MKTLTKASLALAAGIVLVGQPAFAEKTGPLNLGWGAFPDVPQLTVAFDRNLWKDEGIEVKLNTFTSGRESFEALLGGQLDFAVIAELPAVIGAMRRQRFAILSIMSEYSGNRIIGTTKIAMSSVKDLAGKRIGTTVGTALHFILGAELQRAGVQAEVVNAAPGDVLTALVRGDIDAAVLFSNLNFPARNALGDRYREILLRDYPTYFVLIVSPEILEKRAELVPKVLRALLKAEGIVNSDPNEAQQAVSRAVGKSLSMEVIKAIWPDYTFKMGLDPLLLDLMEREGRWVRDRGAVKDVEPSQALFRSYIKEEALKGVAPERMRLK